MKNLLSLLLYFYTNALFTHPTLQWQKTFGGTQFDEATSIQQTNDGGYIVCGYTLSNNGDVIGNHGAYDFWIIKLTDVGMIQWKKTLGGSDTEWAYFIQQTNDGGYVVSGFTQSNNGDVSGNHGDKDCWIVKLNNMGVTEWQKTFGGGGWDEAWCMRQTNDGGYVIAGRSNSLDGDVTGNHGASDFWIVKISDIGVVEWQKSLGGSLDDKAYSIRQTLDGGYIVAGETDSNDGDVSDNNGGTDYWVVKLNELGDIQWQKALGSSSLDRSNDVYQTSDGGYIVLGEVSGNDGDVTGHHGNYDYWVVKLNIAGDIQWQHALGGSGKDYGKSIQQTNDGGYILAGYTQSTNGDVLDNDGGQDFWLMKLNFEGEIQWQQTLGGTKAERLDCIQQTSDDGYIIAGYTWSSDGDASGVIQGYFDFWVVKLSSESVGVEDVTIFNPDQHLDIYPNPANQSISITAASEEPSLTICISDLLGRQFIQQTIPNGGQADIAMLPKGLYLVVATTPSGKVFSNKISKV